MKEREKIFLCLEFLSNKTSMIVFYIVLLTEESSFVPGVSKINSVQPFNHYSHGKTQFWNNFKLLVVFLKVTFYVHVIIRRHTLDMKSYFVLNTT